MPRTYRYLSLDLLGLVALTIASGCATGESDVSMNDLPPAVRATIESETSGGKIKDIEKKTKNGETVYTADAELNGKMWDITVASDGKLVSKAVDEGEDDDD